MFVQLGRSHIHGKSKFDSLVSILEYFLEVLSLGDTSRQRGNLCPESPFFRLVNNDLDFYDFSLSDRFLPVPCHRLDRLIHRHPDGIQIQPRIDRGRLGGLVSQSLSDYRETGPLNRHP